MRTTGLLMWQVKRHVDEEVDREALQWREEKARGLAEFESMEAEADEERMRRIQVEEELMVRSPLLVSRFRCDGVLT